ncbi:hypothetical protein BDV59DRAFT_187988 [Aspergillus ambiguus]|uniref:F-box protein n=1 Tax=Aspergillus ambiguus TaxID=176160 RepID=UPI003CCD8D2F
METPTATSWVLQTPELLSLILNYLPQGKLLQLQRVSRSWCSLIRKAPNLCATTFTNTAFGRHTSTNPPKLNTFVINRLRWFPSLDLTLVNTPQFRAVETDPILRAIAHENASWRDQYLTWPPASRLSIIHGTIYQEEPSLPGLCMTCHQSDPGQSFEDEGNSDAELSDSERPLPLVLCVREFPHNAGRECTGITVLDMLYGLRLHYLEEKHTLQSYLRPHFERNSSGEILARFEIWEPEVTVDVTFINF